MSTLTMAETEQSISLAGMPPLHDVGAEESDEALSGDQADTGDGWDTDLEVDGEWTGQGWTGQGWAGLGPHREGISL